MNESPPEHTQIVVIGGGIMGCSTAYHLTKNGCRDVILLERAKLTSGTTWHSAAQVRQLRSTESLTRLVQHSVELYSSLEAETGQATGWKQTGSLSIATNPDRLTHIRRQASLSRAFGIGAEEIPVAEASGTRAADCSSAVSNQRANHSTLSNFRRISPSGCFRRIGNILSRSSPTRSTVFRNSNKSA